MFWGESGIKMKPLQWCPRTVCGLNLAKPNLIVAPLERFAPDLIVIRQPALRLIEPRPSESLLSSPTPRLAP